MLSWICCDRSSSVSPICSITLLSIMPSTKLRMSAAFLTPPRADDLTLVAPENCFSRISSSSCSAAGWIPSRLATRITTSVLTRSGNSDSTPAAWSGSRNDSTMAMICGCSRRINSAIARASIHFSCSSPLLFRPSRMRSMMPPALSAPSAEVSMLRMNWSEPTPSEVCSPMVPTKFCITSSICELVTWLKLAIARPISCTSFGPICRRISAACRSPRPSISNAERSRPLRFCTFCLSLF